MENYQQNESRNLNNENKEMLVYPMWKILVTCFRGARHYGVLLKQGGSRKVLYFFFLLLISSIFSFMVPVIGSIMGVGGIGNYIESRVPEFQFEGGQLQTQEPITYEKENVKIYVDTSVESYTKDDLDQDLTMEMLVSKNNIMMLNNRVVQETKLSDLAPLSCSKQWLLDHVSLFYFAIVGVYIFTYLSDAFSLLFLMVMLVLIGMLTNSMHQADLKFSQMFSLALFASTMQLLIMSVNSSIGIVSPLIANIIGVVWTAFTYFGAITWMGMMNQGFGPKQD